MLCESDRKHALAHAWPARNNDQIAGMKPRRLGVEVDQPRRKTRDAVAGVAGDDGVFRVLDELNHSGRSAAGFFAVGAHLEHGALSSVKQFFRRATLRPVAQICYIAADTDQPAQHRSLAHDLRIGQNVGCTRRIVGERAQISQPAGLIEPALVLQVLGQRDEIAGPVGADQFADRAINQLVVFAVEVLRSQPVGELVPGAIVQHQSAEHRLLGFDRVRRQLGPSTGHAASERS